jgi:putative tryptophan/tyrosine transport system substrate-binding protein
MRAGAVQPFTRLGHKVSDVCLRSGRVLGAHRCAGPNPADIPIEQRARFERVINLKAAKAIGHEVPAELALQADKMIQRSGGDSSPARLRLP